MKEVKLLTLKTKTKEEPTKQKKEATNASDNFKICYQTFQN